MRMGSTSLSPYTTTPPTAALPPSFLPPDFQTPGAVENFLTTARDQASPAPTGTSTGAVAWVKNPANRSKVLIGGGALMLLAALFVFTGKK